MTRPLRALLPLTLIAGLVTACPMGNTVPVAGAPLPGTEFTGPVGTVTTVAGSVEGFADALGPAAKFSHPSGIAVDSSGTLYVAEQGNFRIRKIAANTLVTTLAGGEEGYADGPGHTAKFRNPAGLTVDSAGTVVITDSFQTPRIRTIQPNGTVATLAGGLLGFADGAGAAAQFNNPLGVAISPDGTVYVSDSANHRIRQIDRFGVVSTVAGGTQGAADGRGTAAQFNNPTGLTLDPDGTLYVADTGNHRIRQIQANATVSTLAGSDRGLTNGKGAAARFNSPTGVDRDGAGNLYVADGFNHRIRKIAPGGTVTTYAGGANGHLDGPADKAQFSSPFDVAVDGQGAVYVADQGNHRIRRITPPPASGV